MVNFYFTFSREGQPHSGGWTRVVAKDIREACRTFEGKYPRLENGYLPCAFVYTEKEFRQTKMSEKGCFGIFEHEMLVSSSCEGGGQGNV